MPGVIEKILNMKSNEKIESYIKDIRDTIIAATYNHDIWWIYKSKDTRPKYNDVMNNYLAFFQTSIHAHFVAMIIALYRLFETRRDTINFTQLIRMLDKNNQLSKSAKSKIDVLLEKAKPIWIKVGIIRSEVFAHSSDERNTEESFQKADIKYRQFRDLIDLSENIANIITQDYCKNTHAFNLSAKKDTKDLLNDLLKTL